jgi:hypothetical protein
MLCIHSLICFNTVIPLFGVPLANLIVAQMFSKYPQLSCINVFTRTYAEPVEFTRHPDIKFTMLRTDVLIQHVYDTQLTSI